MSTRLRHLALGVLSAVHGINMGDMMSLRLLNRGHTLHTEVGFHNTALLSYPPSTTLSGRGDPRKEVVWLPVTYRVPLPTNYSTYHYRFSYSQLYSM